MDDFKSWWYIIIAVIYYIFSQRGKKKKDRPDTRPGSENNPPLSQPKSFEDLLKEITGDHSVEEGTTSKQEPIVIEQDSKEENEKLEDGRRFFEDDESKKVYDESIKMAEEADLTLLEEGNSPKENTKDSKNDDEHPVINLIRDGLSSSEARKAIIYSEILTRKY